MGSRWLSRLTVAAAAAGALTLGTATSAWAADTITIPINDGNVPTTAEQFESEDPQKREADCKDIVDFFNSLPDSETASAQDIELDGWHFILPTGDSEFEAIRLTFTKPGGAVVNVTIEGSSDDPAWLGVFKETGSEQVKHAYLLTEAGWTLTGGEADITGTADQFNLSHTCAGITVDDDPSSPTPTPGTPNGSTPPGNGGGGGGLPVTGTAVGGIVVIGIGLLAAGVALMAVRRRRDLGDLTDV